MYGGKQKPENPDKQTQKIVVPEEKKPVVIHVTDVTLNKTSTTLTVGGTETLTATVLPADATDKSVT